MPQASRSELEKNQVRVIAERVAKQLEAQSLAQAGEALAIIVSGMICSQDEKDQQEMLEEWIAFLRKMVEADVCVMNTIREQ